ncbi:hypothetical protein FNV43_RR19106 [Rhamnella rubrinervis]|uniref:Transposase (putative) gypsy type domain-containing protein n=1 Tax=Rhamnella rubrinervis TaxID=2594499 RepID=A0A8K0E7K6_9ROSA|nr:hypothetical protein FNV43_RR19106 [Rhamnella rubrinervis]
MIKTDIPSIFKPEDIPYLKKRYGFPENAVLSAPVDKKRADSVRDGWICFYEIAFKLGLRLPFHRIISMVLKYFNLAPGQLIPNGWHYLLRLIVLSEQLGQHIDMPIFLHFFYLKPSGEGPNLLSICAALNQSAKLSTNTNQNESLDILRAAEKNLNLLLTAKSFRSIGYWPSQKKAQKAGPSQPLAESTPRGGTIITIIAQPKDLVAAATVERSPPQKKQRRASPPVAAEDKEPLTPKANLGLEDSSSIRSKASLAAPIVDCLMTRRDRNILKSMPLDDVCQEAEQGALKVDNAFKKKAAAYTNAIATNKTLEADIVQLKEAVADANARAEQAKKKWSEADQKLIEKEKELESLRLDFSRVVAERDEWQTRGLAWPKKKKIVYRKGVEDAYLRAQKEMILKFKRTNLLADT